MLYNTQTLYKLHIENIHISYLTHFHSNSSMLPTGSYASPTVSGCPRGTVVSWNSGSSSDSSVGIGSV